MDDVAMGGADDADGAEATAGDWEEQSTFPETDTPKRTTFLECVDFTMARRATQTGLSSTSALTDARTATSNPQWWSSSSAAATAKSS